MTRGSIRVRIFIVVCDYATRPWREWFRILCEGDKLVSDDRARLSKSEYEFAISDLSKQLEL